MLPDCVACFESRDPMTSVSMMIRQLTSFFVAVVMCIALATHAQQLPIPELAWEEIESWINVKTDVSPEAVGDGQADDTDALQAALDLLKGHRGDAKVVYLPEGTYRITRSLVMPSGSGNSVVGHGRDSQILWDGNDTLQLHRMLWCSGVIDSKFVGISWNGNAKAAIGVHHKSHTVAEGGIFHEHSAFLGFRVAGIKWGAQPDGIAQASSIRNCLFANCASGVEIVDDSHGLIAIEGCEFHQCNTGVLSMPGAQSHIRSCRFEKSGESDIVLGDSLGHTIRRCTSLRSKRFILGHDVTIQDCNVAGWQALDGAILIDSPRSPVSVFDCRFTMSPEGIGPIVVGDKNTKLTVSNNRLNAGPVVVGGGGVAVSVEKRAEVGTLSWPQQRFLQRCPNVPGKVFDAVRDFGVNFSNDATAQVQATIDAAREHGNGAIAYFPAGEYSISRRLLVTGRDYIIGGTGVHTRFRWKGRQGRVLLRVRDPQDIRIQDIQFLGSITRSSIAIHQVSGGRGSSVQYDRVVANRGHVVFDRLTSGDHVHVRSIRGSGYFTGCEAATILIDQWDGGTITVKASSAGKSTDLADANSLGTGVNPTNGKIKKGFLGFIVAYVEQLRVYDNAELIVGDLIIRAGRDPSVWALAGAATVGGRLTLGAFGRSSGGTSARIENYGGRFAYVNRRSDSALNLVQQGDHAVDIVILGHGRGPLNIAIHGKGRKHLVQNLAAYNMMHKNTMSLLTDTLDHYAELNKVHAELFNQM